MYHIREKSHILSFSFVSFKHKCCTQKNSGYEHKRQKTTRTIVTVRDGAFTVFCGCIVWLVSGWINVLTSHILVKISRIHVPVGYITHQVILFDTSYHAFTLKSHAYVSICILKSIFSSLVPTSYIIIGEATQSQAIETWNSTTTNASCSSN